MKNALTQVAYTRQIADEKPDPKTFYRFIGIFEKQISQSDVIINSHIKLHLVNQPQSEDISRLKPKDHVLVFGQVVEQNKLLEGQIRKVTLQESLQFDRLMKKLKFKTFLDDNFLGSQNKGAIQDQKNNGPKFIGHRNGGFYQHF